jgi:hypothetical protein
MSFPYVMSPYAPSYPLPKDNAIHLAQLYEWLQDMENMPYESMELECCQKIYQYLLSHPAIMILYADLRQMILEKALIMGGIIQSRIIQLNIDRWEWRFQEDKAELKRSVVCSELQSLLLSQMEFHHGEIQQKHKQYTSLLATFELLRVHVGRWGSHPQWVVGTLPATGGRFPTPLSIGEGMNPTHTPFS